MENADLVSAAHEIRLGLAPPHQSLFRVVCILIYEDSSGNLCRLIGKVYFVRRRCAIWSHLVT